MSEGTTAHVQSSSCNRKRRARPEAGQLRLPPSEQFTQRWVAGVEQQLKPRLRGALRSSGLQCQG